MKELCLIMILSIGISTCTQVKERYLTDFGPDVIAKMNPKFVEEWNPKDALPYSWPCPEENDIAPCVCTWNSNFDIDLDCTPVTTDVQIVNVFKAKFTFERIRKFDIIHEQTIPDGIVTFGPEIFGNQTFEIVTIQGTQLSVITEEVFSKSHSTLKTLNLDRNNLIEFPFSTISLYTHLYTLSLNRNFFSELPAIKSSSLAELFMNGNSQLHFDISAFQFLPNIEVIGLEEIDLEEVLPDLFVSLTKLTELKLGFNRITNLEERAINPQGSITQLRLEHNPLTSIYHDSISGMDPDGQIDFSHGDIIDLVEEDWVHVFAQLSRAGTIHLQGNNLKCGCEIYWIKKNSVYDEKINSETKCFDGTKFSILPIEFFDKHCQDWSP